MDASTGAAAVMPSADCPAIFAFDQMLLANRRRFSTADYHVARRYIESSTRGFFDSSLQSAREFKQYDGFFTTTMVQISSELEESARIHGDSWSRTFLRIWLPLLRPAVIGAWILLFVIAVRVLDVVVLLAGPGARMLSVDIFFWTVTGRQEAASVLALVQTALVVVGYVAVRVIACRTLQQSTP